MKRYIICSVLGLLVLSFTACVNDLNTKPIDKNSTTSFNQDAVFSKCFATLALSGQKGPDGDCDLDDIDEGTSSFYRMMWELNEFGTDEGWWIWNDVGLADIRIMNWNGDNALVKGLYFRLNIDIKICNHFLANADDALAKTASQKAEVRFIRALNAWYLLDMFKVAPFMTTDMAPFKAVYPISGTEIVGTNSAYPPFLTRQQLYDWLVEELNDLVNCLPEARSDVYRIDKYAAYQLLARTYLFAEIHTGTPAWDKAIEAADKALAGPYHLMEQATTNMEGITFTGYQKLFMADNNTNGAQDECPLMIYQDGVMCRCWGGSRFVINMVRDKDSNPVFNGSSDTWKCFRTSPEFVYKFVSQDKAGSFLGNEYELPKLLGDDRAIMCNHTDVKDWSLSGPASDDFYASWGVHKFNNIVSTCDSLKGSVSSDPAWTDTDLPLLRIAEAYMIKAEALFRQGKTADALTIINDVIRKRAHAAELTELTEETLCDEWSREFYCEGRRRSDLIRFNRFAGPKSDENGYHWEGRGNKPSAPTGSFVSGVEEKWNWYPVPNDDKGTNPNFKTIEGGDGY